MSEIKTGEIEVVRSKKSDLILQLSGGAIFGALSTVMAVVLSPIINASRITGWGIAMFDPTSWVWIICFLIFGTYAGLISCVTGSFGLLIIDPSGWVGPVFKFTATVPLIIVPFLILQLWEKNVTNSSKVRKPGNFIITGIISVIFRILIMIGMNFLFFIAVWGIEALPHVSLEVIGLGDITGVSAVLIFTPIINLYAGALDLAVPYFLVFGAKLDEKFGFW